MFRKSKQIQEVASNKEDKDKTISPISLEIASHLTEMDTTLSLDDVPNLSVPLLPASFIKFQFEPTKEVKEYDIHCPQNEQPIPSCVTPISEVSIIRAERLNPSDSVKRTYLVEFDIENKELDYEPGDSFGIICHNDHDEVIQLLDRLEVTEEDRNKAFSLTIEENTKKRKPLLPAYIPECISLYDALYYCIDIRAVPKKAFIRSLADCCTKDLKQKRKLLELCSKQGMLLYTNHVRNPLICILDILLSFSDCTPPISLLFEHLPRLLPRPYSVSSSRLHTPTSLSFVYNVIEFPHEDGRTSARTGICSKLLESLSSKDLATDPQNLQVFLRRPTNFRLPADETLPLILIGPGTGVAPFISFLRHRNCIRNNEAASFGDIVLYFGCRKSNTDFIFREELEQYKSRGLLKQLNVAFSRQENKQYVQDLIKENKESIADYIINQNAIVMVCGDAAGMAKDVSKTISDIIRNHQGVGDSEISDYMLQMQKTNRYIEDIWT